MRPRRVFISVASLVACVVVVFAAYAFIFRGGWIWVRFVLPFRQLEKELARHQKDVDTEQIHLRMLPMGEKYPEDLQFLYLHYPAIPPADDVQAYWEAPDGLQGRLGTYRPSNGGVYSLGFYSEERTSRCYKLGEVRTHGGRSSLWFPEGTEIVYRPGGGVYPLTIQARFIIRFRNVPPRVDMREHCGYFEKSEE
jgi:hypothetical protein